MPLVELSYPSLLNFISPRRWSVNSVYDALWHDLLERRQRIFRVSEPGNSALSLFTENRMWYNGQKFSLSDLIQVFQDRESLLDHVPWLITFSLVDRLLSTAGISSPEREHCHFLTTAFAPHHSLHLMFAVFCLSLKLHADCPVQVSDLVECLPLSQVLKKTLTLQTLQLELHILRALNYNCSVSSLQLSSYLSDTLTPDAFKFILRKLELK